MGKTIVTVGGGYIDVDGLACAIAYAELLRLEWVDAAAVMTDVLNGSITPSLRAIAQNYLTESVLGDAYVVVDISEPRIISWFAPLDRIVEVYDHHFGYESYWQERLGDKSRIEPIGAAATLIWEEYVRRWYVDRISTESAILLAHAIISNTVNFTFEMTCDRDRMALAELEGRGWLSDGWREKYFLEQQSMIERDVARCILDDTKRIYSTRFGDYSFWQAEVWDVEWFLQRLDCGQIFQSTWLESWIFNCVDIQRAQTYIMSNNPAMLRTISQGLWYPIEDDCIRADRAILRKKILPILAD